MNTAREILLKELAVSVINARAEKQAAGKAYQVHLQTERQLERDYWSQLRELRSDGIAANDILGQLKGF